MALQVGGALGVAVIGSVLSTRYQDRMAAALVGRHVPIAATHAILGSLGGALAVAAGAGGATGGLLARAARTAFMSGNQLSLAVAAVVAAGGAVLVLARLPTRPINGAESEDDEQEVAPSTDPSRFDRTAASDLSSIEPVRHQLCGGDWTLIPQRREDS